MGFDDRLYFLLIGMAIGFILGRFSTRLDKIKEELDEVDEIVKKKLNRNEDGFIHPTVANIALIFVVFLAAVSTFLAQKASNDSNDARNRLTNVVTCMETTLNGTVSALNERSAYTVDQAQGNVQLVQNQFDFLTFLAHKPPFSQAQQVQAYMSYVGNVHSFVEINTKAANKIKNNPYPRPTALQDCIDNAEGEQ